jgi:hypothetical protein
MPLERRSVQDDAGLVAEGEGEVGAAELIRLNEELVASPERLRRLRWVLIDLERVERLAITLAELEQVVALQRSIVAVNPDAFVAVVGPRDFVFGVARMWQAMACTLGIAAEVFRASGAAHEWLTTNVQDRFGFRPELDHRLDSRPGEA